LRPGRESPIKPPETATSFLFCSQYPSVLT